VKSNLNHQLIGFFPHFIFVW